MQFRPCIDIHNGKVKQIVGGSLMDDHNQAVENYCAKRDADYFAGLYKKDGLKGGHVIMLNPPSSAYYQKTKDQAFKALAAYPGGLQAGGGITDLNAAEYIQAGASHVIVTSYVFREGNVCWEHMEKLKGAVGKEKIVIDLSCRIKQGSYYIVTDRWQKFTNVELNLEALDEFSGYCDEFLVHGVDAEGLSSGFEEDLVRLLGQWNKIPVTYAGGIGSMEELERFQEVSGGKVDFTVGSALDLFGGSLPYDSVKTCSLQANESV